MGNLTVNKMCCCQQTNIENQLQTDFKTKSHQNALPILTINPQHIVQPIQQNKSIQQSVVAQQKENNDNTDLQINLPQLKLHPPKYFEIYLSPDQSWYRTLENNAQFPINIEETYKQIANIKSEDELWSKKIVRRSAYDNKKIQLLFKQHIPTIGKYFFEVDLISYLPHKKCEFTIGVVNYNFAKGQIHSRDSPQEQSLTFIERKFDVDQKHINVPIQLNLKFKVEITREDQPQIAFYIKGKQLKRQLLKKSLQNEVISLVPYIQTQYQGIVFGWKSSLKRSISGYKISTIFEQTSSIISA